MALQDVIKPSTSAQRKQEFLEVFINGQNKVTKISDNSVVSALSGGVSHIAGRAEKDIFLALAQLFPELADGEGLDQVAANFGVAPRFEAIGSAIFVRVTADPGTKYTPNIHTFKATNGVEFRITEEVTVGLIGYAYVPVASLTSGANTMALAGTITQVTPQPIGHKHVVNEFQAWGGRDRESDESFALRIKEGGNVLAKETLSKMTQIAMFFDPRILRVFHSGINEVGKTVLSIATQNGATLTEPELNALLDNIAPHLSLVDHAPHGRKVYGVTLQNIEYQPIDISFRLELTNARSIDEVRMDIQNRICRFFDLRFFDSSTTKVEWDDLLHIVKQTSGVKQVLDQFFYPRVDVPIDLASLPRLRGFIMMDLTGAVLSNNANTLAPIYYPPQADFAYQNTLLR